MVAPSTRHLQEGRWSRPIWKLPIPIVISPDPVSHGMSTHFRVLLFAICVASKAGESSHFSTLESQRGTGWVCFFLPSSNVADWSNAAKKRRKTGRGENIGGMAVVPSLCLHSHDILKGLQPKTLSQLWKCSLRTNSSGSFHINLLPQNFRNSGHYSSFPLSTKYPFYNSRSQTPWVWR